MGGDDMRKTVCIRDLGFIITGKTPPTTNKKYYGDKYLFIKPTDISEASKYTYETEDSIKHMNISSLDRFSLLNSEAIATEELYNNIYINNPNGIPNPANMFINPPVSLTFEETSL